MIVRRQFLQSAAALPVASLAGCTELRFLTDIGSSAGAIDIHCHVFNGRDVPRVGFIQQVILRDPHSNRDPSILTEAFLKLLAYILLSNTPSAREELKRLEQTAPATTPALAPTRQNDQRNVAQAIARFNREQAAQAASGLTRSRDREVIDLLYQETGLQRSVTGLVTPTAEADQLAAAIYAPATAPSAEPKRRVTAYRLNKSPVLQTIRWAGLLTRPREEIYGELVALYGGEDGISVYSPSIVDFELWFKTREKVTPIRDQVDVMSALARRRTDALLLNFAPYCPLRAALLAEDDPTADPLVEVKRAVTERGFAGVKLYPPVGFRPLGNEDIPFTFAKRVPTDRGRALDRQLTELYAWCQSNDVPIKAHANNSLDADVCSGLYASPANWRPVLDKYPRLRLNLAHFGGFDENGTSPDPLALSNRCPTPDTRDWEEILTDMLASYRGLYFDLGYWIEVSDGGLSRRVALTKVQSLIAREPLVLRRMMYGSDWSMIGRETTHPIYRVSVLEALGELGLSPARINAIEGANARRYLGINRRGKQFDRLNRFFDGHPIWTRELAIA